MSPHTYLRPLSFYVNIIYIITLLYISAAVKISYVLYILSGEQIRILGRLYFSSVLLVVAHVFHVCGVVLHFTHDIMYLYITTWEVLHTQFTRPSFCLLFCCICLNIFPFSHPSRTLCILIPILPVCVYIDLSSSYYIFCVILYLPPSPSFCYLFSVYPHTQFVVPFLCHSTYTLSFHIYFLVAVCTYVMIP